MANFRKKDYNFTTVFADKLKVSNPKLLTNKKQNDIHYDHVLSNWRGDLEDHSLTPVIAYPIPFRKNQKPYYSFIDKDNNILQVELDSISSFVGPIAVGIKDSKLIIFNKKKGTIEVRADNEYVSANVSLSDSMDYQYAIIRFFPKDFKENMKLELYFDLETGDEMDEDALNQKIEECLEFSADIALDDEDIEIDETLGR